jgi:hypothetical protein
MEEDASTDPKTGRTTLIDSKDFAMIRALICIAVICYSGHGSHWRTRLPLCAAPVAVTGWTVIFFMTRKSWDAPIGW